jgi:hypothetical protein
MSNIDDRTVMKVNPELKSSLFLKAPSVVRNGQFSPDGRWVAYASNESGKWGVKPEVVRALAETRGIPARRVGDQWRFSHAALLEWLKGEPAAGTASAVPDSTGSLDPTQIPNSELHELTARGGMRDAPASTSLAPAEANAPPDTPQSPSVGERPTTPTTAEIALRDQSVLLARGAATIDFSASYGRSDQTLYPVIRAEYVGVGHISKPALPGWSHHSVAA